MTRVTKIACDNCGAVKADPPPLPWWDFMYSSMDFPLPNGGTAFRSGGWELCPACSITARDALIAAVGAPSHDADGLE